MSDSSLELRAPNGTHDVLWPESSRWEKLIGIFSRLVESAGYGLTITPTFEDSRLFRRGIGEESEVVRKEMYEFSDRGGRHFALRPEGTAPMVRAFIQHRPTLPWKVWYGGPSFRYERPQAGRYRQHHQLGIEALGSYDPDLDTEVISLANEFYGLVGLESVALKINSMGDSLCRSGYIQALRESLEDKRDQLCSEHQARLDANPLRVLDCKRQECLEATKDVPWIVDFLCSDCSSHFERVQDGLGCLGVGFEIDNRLVRGYDYYTRTAFEFSSSASTAAQNALGGGGRYDALVEMLGGPPTPGIGFGIGIERVLLACDAESTFAVRPQALDVYVIDITDGTTARMLTALLRKNGLKAERGFDSRSLKSQMKSADRSNASLALIIGSQEVASGSVTLRRLRVEAQQIQIPISEVVEQVKKILREDIA